MILGSIQSASVRPANNYSAPASTTFDPAPQNPSEKFIQSDKEMGLGKDLSTMIWGTVGFVGGTVVGTVAGLATNYGGLAGAGTGALVGGVAGAVLGRVCYNSSGDWI